MTTQHTPGPWRVVMSAGNVDSRVNAYQIKYGTSGNPLCIVDGTGNSALDNEANAKLIAAAPDLLAALQQAQTLLHSMTLDPEDYPVTDAIHAAIAKATGETA